MDIYSVIPTAESYLKGRGDGSNNFIIITK